MVEVSAGLLVLTPPTQTSIAWTCCARFVGLPCLGVGEEPLAVWALAFGGCEREVKRLEMETRSLRVQMGAGQHL